MTESKTKFVAASNRDWADEMATELLATTTILLAARLRLLKVEAQRDALVEATEEIKKTFAEPAPAAPVRGGAKWLP